MVARSEKERLITHSNNYNTTAENFIVLLAGNKTRILQKRGKSRGNVGLQN